MKNLIFLSIAFMSILVSCKSEKYTVEKLSKHEMLYIETSDSLSCYLDVSLVEKAMEQDSTITHYTNMDYSSFKKKYSLDDSEMDVLAESLKVTYRIARALKSLDVSMEKGLDIDIDSTIDNSTKEYRFEKRQLNDSSWISIKDSNIIKLLKQANDFQSDTL